MVSGCWPSHVIAAISCSEYTMTLHPLMPPLALVSVGDNLSRMAVPPYCLCRTANRQSIIFYHEMDRQPVSGGVSNTFVKRPCSACHVPQKAPDGLSRQSKTYGDRQSSAYNRRGEEAVLPTIQGDAVSGQYLPLQPFCGDALQECVKMTAVRAYYPIRRFDMFEDVNQDVLVTGAQMNRGPDFILSEQVSYFMLESDKRSEEHTSELQS